MQRFGADAGRDQAEANRQLGLAPAPGARRCSRPLFPATSVTAPRPSPVGFPPKHQRFDNTNVLFGNIFYFPAGRTTASLLILPNSPASELCRARAEKSC